MSNPSSSAFQQRYDALKRSLLAIGPVLPGSVVKRMMPCGRDYCGCRVDASKRHGPYYEWTRKVRGKTLTVRLTAEQARLYATWIGNRRRLKKILTRMQAVSLKAARDRA